MVAQQRHTTGVAGPSASSVRPAGGEHLLALTREEYHQIPSRLEKLLDDVADLYAGRWPSHEACEVQYHDVVHAFDVALAVARIMAGWNRAHPDRRLDEELYCWTVAAGLFHDAGYIKDKGDREGHGGKFTITHVQRGIAMAKAYLLRTGWPERAAVFVPSAIGLTDYRRQPEVDEVSLSQHEQLAARMLPTADLVGQFGDSRYAEKIDGLFTEFQELYAHLDQDQPARPLVPVFHSAQELRNTTEDFYESFVAPRLAEFGHLEHYLDVYYGQAHNPYRKNITANLALLNAHRPADQT